MNPFGVETEEGRVLVENGPVVVGIKRAIAILAACLIGVALGGGYVGYRALESAHEISQSRRELVRSGCERQNEHHKKAGPALLVLLHGKKPTPEQQKALDVFVNALVPSEDCAARLAQLR